MDSNSSDGLVLLWSGGKDASLVLDALHSQSPRRVTALVTTILETSESVRGHGTPLSIIQEQARSLDLPLHTVRLPSGAANETYEEHLSDVLAPLLESGVTHVAAGDLFLEDVKAYREDVISSTGARPLFPLWKRDTDWLACHFLKRGYRALITAVDTAQLDPSFLGRPYDSDLLADLPEDVDPCGENGEFHTFVTAGPSFHHSVDVEIGRTEDQGRMHYVQLRRVEGADFHASR